MKGIYLTQEGKQAIEDRIAELEEVKRNCEKDYQWNEAVFEQNSYRQILSRATILPVEESFYTVENKLKYHCGRTGCSKDGATLREYPNGVIIKSKQ